MIDKTMVRGLLSVALALTRGVVQCFVVSIVAGCAAFPLALAMVRPVNADSIEYTEQATGSGTLGSSAFSNALVTVTVEGDTTNLYNQAPGFPTLAGATASISVAGIGTAAVTDSLLVFDNQGSGIFLLDDTSPNGEGGAILSMHAPAFDTYAMATSLGPISATTAYTDMYPGFAYANTSLGIFQWTGGGTVPLPVTFTAVEGVPEPTSLTLLGSALLGLGVVYLRRRRAKA